MNGILNLTTPIIISLVILYLSYSFLTLIYLEFPLLSSSKLKFNRKMPFL